MSFDVRLERDGEVDLQFHGREIAVASSDDPGKQRWMVLRLWANASGGWVLERRGETRVSSERTRHSAAVCSTPEAVVYALRKSDGEHSYLPDVALDLLEAAAEVDKRLRSVTVETL